MKSCPQCKRTFDDVLSFCTEDGIALTPPFDTKAGERTQVIVVDSPPPPPNWDAQAQTQSTAPKVLLATPEEVDLFDAKRKAILWRAGAEVKRQDEELRARLSRHKRRPKEHAPKGGCMLPILGLFGVAVILGTLFEFLLN